MTVTPSAVSFALTTADKEKIACAHYKAGHSKTVIIAHGFFNSKDAVLIQRLKDRLIDAYDVILFDFRGHGKSSGFFTWSSQENLDLESVVQYARGKYAEIGLIGFSFGAAISIQGLGKGIMSLIAISPPSDFGKIDYRLLNLDVENDIIYNLGEGKRGKGVRLGPFWLAKKNPIDLADKITCPVLYIHGDKDWVVSYEHSEKLYGKTNSKKKIAIIKNGPHAEYLLRRHADETVSLIRDWLRETL